MSCKPKDNELANEENKQFDPGGKGGSHRFEKRMYWYSLHFVGNSGLGCPVCFWCFCLSVCFVLFVEKSGDHFFLRAEENMRGEKKINGDANQVDEEHSRRVSIFLPINPLKINASRFDSLTTRWEKDRS